MRSENEHLEQPSSFLPVESNRPTAFGFKGRMFPLLAFLLGFISYTFSYLVAANKHPPDVWPFPDTDILHTAIHWP